MLAFFKGSKTRRKILRVVGTYTLSWILMDTLSVKLKDLKVVKF